MEIQNYFYNLPDDLQQKIFKYVYDGCMKDLKGSNVIKLYTLYDTIKLNRDIDYCMYEDDQNKRLSLKEYTINNANLTKLKYISFGLPIINKDENPIYYKAFYDKFNEAIRYKVSMLSYNGYISYTINGVLFMRNTDDDPKINIIKSEYIDNNFNVYFKDPMRCNADIAINIINGYSFVKEVIEWTIDNYLPDNEDIENFENWVGNHRFLEGWEIGKKGKGRYIRIDPYFGS
jgi:hypothetical protein